MLMESVGRMEENLSLDAFKSEIKCLSECCLAHPQGFEFDDIEIVDHWVQATDDEIGYALFKMKDGRWGTLDEYRDYTGHG